MWTNVLALSIANEAHKNGYSIMLCDSQNSTKLEVDSLQLFQSRKVDGLIVCPIGDDQPYSDYLSTPMTTVSQQTAEMGQIAFKILIGQIDGESNTGTNGVVLPT